MGADEDRHHNRLTDKEAEEFDRQFEKFAEDQNRRFENESSRRYQHKRLLD